MDEGEEAQRRKRKKRRLRWMKGRRNDESERGKEKRVSEG